MVAGCHSGTTTVLPAHFDALFEMSSSNVAEVDARLVNILSHPKSIAGGIFLVALCGRLAYWALAGTSVGAITDTWLAYSSYSVTEITSTLLSEELAQFVLYLGYWLPLSTVTKISGGSLNTMVAVQILLSSLGCVLVFDIGRRHVNLLCGTIAGLSMAVLFESFAWSTRVLSDSLFTFVLTAAIWRLGLYQQNKTTRNRILALLVLGYLTITRPFGAPIVFGWLLYDMSKNTDVRLDLFKSRRLLKGLVGIGLPIVATILVWRWGTVMIDFWSRGVLVADDPSFPRYPFAKYTEESISFIPLGDTLISVGKFMLFNIHHIVAMGIIKVLVYFLPVVPRFSTLHNAINIFTFVPVYSLGFLGIVRMYRTDRQLFRLVVTPLLVILLIISLTFTDWGWGYRAPTGPIFAIAAGYAISVDNRINAIQNRFYERLK